MAAICPFFAWRGKFYGHAMAFVFYTEAAAGAPWRCKLFFAFLRFLRKHECVPIIYIIINKCIYWFNKVYPNPPFRFRLQKRKNAKREADGYFEKMDSKASLRQRNTSTSNLKPLAVGNPNLQHEFRSRWHIAKRQKHKNPPGFGGICAFYGAFQCKNSPSKTPFSAFLQRNAKVLQR